MNATHVIRIAQELGLKVAQVEATATLLMGEATVPFIARYRKEVTGGMDEVAIAAVRDRMLQLAELDKRREAVVKSIEEQGKMTDELRAQIAAAETMSVLEDLYLPYRPKRRTRAIVAKEKGLEPLAMALWEQKPEANPDELAAAYVNAEKGVADAAAALAGARDILAEMMNEDAAARAKMRDLFMAKALFRCKVAAGKEAAGAKFKDYFDWQEPAAKAPSHRVLAMRRGEKEEILALRVLPEEADGIALLEQMFVKGENASAAQVKEAAADCYKRLMSMSMETEVRLEAKKRADAEAIRVFAQNLRQLLLAAPLGQKNVLGIDPGQRTGCKVVCLDRQGKLLANTTIYPHAPQNRTDEAAAEILALVKEHQIEAIAIGNGTAGRETESFVRKLSLPEGVIVVMVNEAGASVYSASAVAREEFPDHDVTVRGSVSIGRRLMDPLAELVKIDPKSIGVGQYQHDVDQGELKRSLDDVVTSCVNAVGVEVNTASKELLTYVAGLGPSLAKAILQYRNEHGPFRSREELKQVPRLGPKAFEQCAGFLRIRDGENPLDASAVHPETYPIVQAMARDVGCQPSDLMKSGELRHQVQINLAKYVTEAVGMPTLTDIMQELAKPGRDPRKQFEVFKFADGVEKIDDLAPGMKLPGVVTNITNFGVFVDIGVHQDGLAHVSALSSRFVKNPADVVKLHEAVTVWVLAVDKERKRISLSLTDPAAAKESKPRESRPRTEPSARPQRTRAGRPAGAAPVSPQTAEQQTKEAEAAAASAARPARPAVPEVGKEERRAPKQRGPERKVMQANRLGKKVAVAAPQEGRDSRGRRGGPGGGGGGGRGGMGGGGMGGGMGMGRREGPGRGERTERVELPQEKRDKAFNNPFADMMKKKEG